MPNLARKLAFRWWRGPTRQALALLIVILSPACATNPAPNDWLPGASEVPADPFGAWIRIDYESGSSRQEVAGELLAVEPDTVYVLAGESVVAFPCEAILKARVAWFESGAGILTAWTFLGSLASFSNGYIGGLTLPLWIISGSIATGAQSRAPLVDYRLDQGRPSVLRPYARFPQGLPEGIDRSTLVGKRIVRTQ
jgi:hypothetical protein